MTSKKKNRTIRIETNLIRKKQNNENLVIIGDLMCIRKSIRRQNKKINMIQIRALKFRYCEIVYSQADILREHIKKVHNKNMQQMI